MCEFGSSGPPRLDSHCTFDVMLRLGTIFEALAHNVGHGRPDFALRVNWRTTMAQS